MRQLAESALKDYGLGTARTRFFYHAGNTLYRVYNTSFRSSPLNDDLFEPGQYLLRIYQPDWQTPQAVQLELAWLSAMRNEGRLPVPEPVSRLDGELVSHISTPGIPQSRMCALLRWVRVRQLPDFGRVEHYHALGRLMGCMHRFTQM